MPSAVFLFVYSVAGRAAEAIMRFKIENIDTYSEADLTQWIFNQDIKKDLLKPNLGEVGPSVVCLGITDAGRCCFDKTTALLAGCCGGITSSYIFQKYWVLGHLARKRIFRKTHHLYKQIGIYDHGCFSKICAAPTIISLLWSDLPYPCDDARVSEFFLIDFSYLSIWFLQNVINCELEEGLSWNCYGRAVTVAWSYRATVCMSRRTTGPTSAAAIMRFCSAFCRLELKNRDAHIDSA